MEWKRGWSAVVGTILLLAFTACGAAEPSTDASPEATPPGDSASAAESESPEVRPEPADSFLAWLEASRKPDVDAACEVLTDELVERMLAEMAATGFPGVDTCEDMIELTADLYRAAGSSAEVSIEVQEATDTDAVLFVTYTDSGNCGTVVMAWETGKWMITEQTEECDGD
ncbi:hypothetical protein ACFQ3B_06705 [Stackebrandtia endophytica]|uniref:hypothetical protein n=1 Tax=Stackebrandtia endophytica TaxID=1496996 RepID=UPI0011543A80|nr:hypothetical protein [Stackebrandtia endophytica]